MLKADETTQVHTLWFVGWGYGDLFAYVYKPEGEPWIAEYRFRWYTAPKVGDPFQENDKKTWYTYKNRVLDDPPAHLIMAMNMITEMTCNNYQASVYDIVEVNGTGLEAIAALENKLWCFIKEVPISESENESRSTAN